MQLMKEQQAGSTPRARVDVGSCVPLVAAAGLPHAGHTACQADRHWCGRIRSRCCASLLHRLKYAVPVHGKGVLFRQWSESDSAFVYSTRTNAITTI
eukprot:1025336-Pleurochrysis_carterae.AAC.1